MPTLVAGTRSPAAMQQCTPVRPTSMGSSTTPHSSGRPKGLGLFFDSEDEEEDRREATPTTRLPVPLDDVTAKHAERVHLTQWDFQRIDLNGGFLTRVEESPRRKSIPPAVWNPLASAPEVSSVAQIIAQQQEEARRKDRETLAKYEQCVAELKGQATQIIKEWIGYVEELGKVLQQIDDKRKELRTQAKGQKEAGAAGVDVSDVEGALVSVDDGAEKLRAAFMKVADFVRHAHQQIGECHDRPELLRQVVDKLSKNRDVLGQKAGVLKSKADEVNAGCTVWTDTLASRIKEVESKAQAEQRQKEEAEKKQKEEEATKKQKEEEEKKAQAQAPGAAPAAAAPTQQPGVGATAVTQNATAATQAPATVTSAAPKDQGPPLPQGLERCTSRVAMKDYTEYLKLRQELEKQSATLDSDPTRKRQRFNAKKEITSALNKIARKWKSITLVFNELANALTKVSNDPALLAAARLAAAEKLVQRGASGVHVNKDEAYAVAAVFVLVCDRMPDMVPVIYSEFHYRCPYIVPLYRPKPNDMSVEEYKMKIGYAKTGENGVFETQEQYEERMKGFVRVYAAIVQFVAPQGHSNPMGIDHGWAWMARMCNLEPRHVTADLLLGFLEIAGYRMHQQYGRQFEKLLNYIYTAYIPKMPESSRPAIERLKIYIEGVKAPGGRYRIPQPEGSNIEN